MKRRNIILWCSFACLAIGLLLLRKSEPIYSDVGPKSPVSPVPAALRPVTPEPISGAESAAQERSAPKSEIKIVIPVDRQNALRVEAQIAEYIQSGKKDAWTLMRHDLLDLGVPREEAIRISKKYIVHLNPMIRYAASETLYILGDRSAAETMIRLVANPTRIPIDGVDSDLRTWAAMTLAKFRETRATDAVAMLYESTKDPSVQRYAAELGARQIIPDLMADMKKRVWKNQLVECAQVGAEEAKPIIVQQFNNEKAALGMRVAAAAAMLRFGEEEPYLSYLLNIAGQYAVDKTVGGDSQIRDAGEVAIRNLGLAHSDKIREFLESALDSNNIGVVQIALVQLRVNYPDSVKARERLLQSFRGEGKLDASTVYRLAAMSNDQDIRSAAAQRNGLLWQKAALHERDWDHDVWLRGVGAK